MITVGAMESAFKIFQGLNDAIIDNKKDRREVFDKIIQPIFDSLTPIVSEYHSMMIDAKRSIESEYTSGERIGEAIEKFRSRRDSISMSRNTAVGLLAGVKISRTGATGFAQDLYKFARDAFGLFWEIEDRDESVERVFTQEWFQRESGTSEALREWECALYDLRELGKSGNLSIESCRLLARGIVDDLSRRIQTLERDWMNVSVEYARLRSFVYKL